MKKKITKDGVLMQFTSQELSILIKALEYKKETIVDIKELKYCIGMIEDLKEVPLSTQLFI